MNPSSDFDSYDDPDFTAYALGEADLEQSTRVRQRLANDPVARARFDDLQQTIDALQQAPLPPRRALHPRQRETVLTMGQIKSLPASTLRPLHHPKRSKNVVWQISKFAAAACLAIGAFFVGQRVSSADKSRPMLASNVGLDQTQTPPPSKPALMEPAAPTVTLIAAPELQNHKPEVPTDRALLPQPAMQPPSMVQLPPASMLNSPPSASAPPAAKVEIAAAAAPQKAVSTAGFILTTDVSESRFVFKPNDARPKPAEFAGIILASPTPIITAPAPKKSTKREAPQPPLQVRSWKAEIASCPWDTDRRLMRLVVQIPVDQPAIEFNEAEYQLQTTFDPKQVRAHRLVAEKHIRPTSGRNQATRIVWYEIVPNTGFSASDDAPATLGRLNIIQPRNSKSADESNLPLMDRGAIWKDAREDFIFETAMVGFGLLLQGKENIGHLNHDLVLNLAEESSSEVPQGERARFIQSVRQAQRAAGL
ncbi:DUF3520 domain-containing protein [Phragmitibacter flavus]|uniref:DUF3520 domain-containing protein n=1 Tax=Phragmitibacter flavus TaxID=2576071 RepID=A0A5R8KBM7_9BACT|nr:YfbK domain-containing protein [Phragmitibacter flavus]TLD69710.1 DUF3520 domain-containing protein [Phragmitibacter flavus]